MSDECPPFLEVLHTALVETLVVQRGGIWVGRAAENLTLSTRTWCSGVIHDCLVSSSFSISKSGYASNSSLLISSSLVAVIARRHHRRLLVCILWMAGVGVDLLSFMLARLLVGYWFLLRWLPPLLTINLVIVAGLVGVGQPVRKGTALNLYLGWWLQGEIPGCLNQASSGRDRVKARNPAG